MSGTNNNYMNSSGVRGFFFFVCARKAKGKKQKDPRMRVEEGTGPVDSVINFYQQPHNNFLISIKQVLSLLTLSPPDS